jgi:hypothetical protein
LNFFLGGKEVSCPHICTLQHLLRNLCEIRRKREGPLLL